MKRERIGPVKVVVPPGEPSDRDQNPEIDEENEAQDRMMRDYRAARGEE